MKQKPFIPHRLPLDNLNWIEFIQFLGAANREIAKFDGKLSSIPNSRILLSPLTTKEAVLSSKIEGTRATLEDVLKFEANPRKSIEKYEEIQEIINYRKAVIMAVSELKKLPLSSRLIRKIHSVLMRGTRGEGKTPGSFRTGSVFIGKQGIGVEGASYIPPEAQEIENYFAELERYIHYEEKDFLVQLAIVHAQFEIIHPFWDGNGRTGRILLPLFLFYKKVLTSPMFYLSEYLEANRDDYYYHLQNTSKNNDWESWIKFFLIAVKKQSEKNNERVQNILSLYNSLKDKIVAIPTPKNAIKVLDFLFSEPVFNSASLIRKTALKRITAMRILKFLVDKKFIQNDRKKRNRTYYFLDLIAIIK